MPAHPFGTQFPGPSFERLSLSAQIIGRRNHGRLDEFMVSAGTEIGRQRLAATCIIKLRPLADLVEPIDFDGELTGQPVQFGRNGRRAAVLDALAGHARKFSGEVRRADCLREQAC